jgi:hypothetical protein
MNTVEIIKAITVRHAPLKDLLPEEREARLKNWAEDKARTKEDEAALVASFRSLTLNQAHELTQYALDRFDAGLNKSLTPQKLLGKIANYVDSGLQDIHAELIARHIYWPEWCYRGANSATRTSLIQSFEKYAADRITLERLMECLVWIGDVDVQRQLNTWVASPPEWSSLLSLPIDEYPLAAGWELTRDGSRRDLYYQSGYELIPPDSLSAMTNSGPIRIMSSHEETCKVCHRPLTTILDLDLSSPQLAFLKLPGERLRVPTCRTIIAEFVYSEIDFQGFSTLYGTYNQHMADLIPLPEGSLVLGSPLRTPYEGVGQYQRSGLSQLGGCLAWAGPARFPRCPSCGQRMVFMGQIGLCDLGEEEGIIHTFLCIQCHKAAVGYQQS